MNQPILATGERPFLRILAIWAVVAVLFVIVGAKGMIAQTFPDPDDSLRLVQVRDLLAGQGWFDLKQHRIDPLGSVPMHWSRLVDLPLAVLIGLLSPVIGQSLAEQVTIVLVPLLTLLVAMNFVWRVTRRLYDAETAGLACLSMGLLPMLVYQFQPMRIDHHGWQIAMAAMATWAIFQDNARRGGAIAGFAMACGIVISLEMLPVAAVFGGVLALRWLRSSQERHWLVGFLQALAASLAVLFAATRGFGDLTRYCDAVTLPHIGFFAVVALGATALGQRAPRNPVAIVGGLGLVAVAAAGVFALASPECVRTPFGALDPLVREFWYENVAEGRPLWDQVPVAYLQYGQLVAALALAVHFMRKAEGERRTIWLEYILLFAGTLALGTLVWRSLAFTSLLAALPMGVMLNAGLASIRNSGRIARKVAVLAAMVVVLVPTAPLAFAPRLLQPNSNNVIGPIDKSSCELNESAQKLAALPAGTIFAPLDIGPTLILDSPHSVVATGHHRAELAMKDVMLAFLSPPDKARAIIDKHQARYVVLCTDLLEPALFAMRGGEGSFAAALTTGTPLAWLEPVELDTPETFRVWRVKRDGTSAPRR